MPPRTVPLAEEDFSIYAEILNELSAEQLDWACREASRSCKWFPTPADILAHVKKDDTTRLSLEASAAWVKVLNYVGTVGANLYDGAGKLTERELKAAKIVGGLGYLEACPADELQWRRKDFIHAYENQAQVEDSRRPLTDGEAKNFLAEAKKRLAE
jgi:hypothetical protein